MTEHKPLRQIGRTVGNTNFAEMMKEQSGEKTFTLKSGKQARFVLKVILPADIERETYVDSAVNGRDQSRLTPESLSNISNTIKLQQFYPAIGRLVNGKIEVLDGSRRRAACMLNSVKFEVMVTEDELSLSDASQLAKDIQTAREHSLRELGKRFQIMFDNGMSKTEIAEAESISPAKVSRAFQAAEVPDELIGLFPSVNDLAIPDYQFLLEVAQKAGDKKVDLAEVVNHVQDELAKKPGLDPLDKAPILDSIRRYATTTLAAPKDPQPARKIQAEKLCEFDAKHTYARKKTDPEKRTTVYEFSRLSVDLQKKIDEAIKSVIEAEVATGKNSN